MIGLFPKETVHAVRLCLSCDFAISYSVVIHLNGFLVVLSLKGDPVTVTVAFIGFGASLITLLAAVADTSKAVLELQRKFRGAPRSTARFATGSTRP